MTTSKNQPVLREELAWEVTRIVFLEGKIYRGRTTHSKNQAVNLKRLIYEHNFKRKPRIGS